MKRLVDGMGETGRQYNRWFSRMWMITLELIKRDVREVRLDCESSLSTTVVRHVWTMSVDWYGNDGRPYMMRASERYLEVGSLGGCCYSE